MSSHFEQKVSGLTSASEHFLTTVEQVKRHLPADRDQMDLALGQVCAVMKSHQEALKALRLQLMIELFEAGVTYRSLIERTGLHSETVLTAMRRHASPQEVEKRSRTTMDQTLERLRDNITTGLYPPGSRLPKSRDAPTKLGVSQVNYLKAVDQLVEEGLVERRGGRRVPYVADDSEETR